MSKNILLSFLIILVVVLALVAGGLGTYVFLAQKEKAKMLPSPTPEPEEAGKTGLANPASVYCKEQGGTLKIEDTEQGQMGTCVLVDGTECEEWAYFQGKCPVESGVVATPKAGKSDQQIIAELFAKKYGKPVGKAKVTIDKNTGTHMSGGIIFEGDMGGGWFLAAKSGGEWVIVADGNGTIPCDKTDPYNFPVDMVPECWDEVSMTLIKR